MSESARVLVLVRKLWSLWHHKGLICSAVYFRAHETHDQDTKDRLFSTLKGLQSQLVIPRWNSAEYEASKVIVITEQEKKESKLTCIALNVSLSSLIPHFRKDLLSSEVRSLCSAQIFQSFDYTDMMSSFYPGCCRSRWFFKQILSAENRVANTCCSVLPWNIKPTKPKASRWLKALNQLYLKQSQKKGPGTKSVDALR